MGRCHLSGQTPAGTPLEVLPECTHICRRGLSQNVSIWDITPLRATTVPDNFLYHKKIRLFEAGVPKGWYRSPMSLRLSF